MKLVRGRDSYPTIMTSGLALFTATGDKGCWERASFPLPCQTWQMKSTAKSHTHTHTQVLWVAQLCQVNRDSCTVLLLPSTGPILLNTAASESLTQLPCLPLVATSKWEEAIFPSPMPPHSRQGGQDLLSHSYISQGQLVHSTVNMVSSLVLPR